MAELAFATITVLKEVYLLSRFVAQTAKSASHAGAEREALQKELEYEHLYLRSFGLLFFQSNGTLVPHEDLNREWLQKIEWVLNGLRIAEGDYAKLAAEKDKGYRRLSPFLNAPSQQNLIAFELFDNEVRELDEEAPKQRPQALATASSGKKLIPALDWRWALSEKKELGRILATSRAWTAKLKELVQLTMAVNSNNINSNAAGFRRWTADGNAKFLGLSGHVRVRQLLEAAPLNPSSLLLENAALELPKQRSTLTPAVLSIDNTVENVIVEVKHIADTESVEEENNILRLAEVLALSSRTDLSTIPLRGLLRLEAEDAFAFIFSHPSGAGDAPPITLFDLIRRPHSVTPGLSLSSRFRIAQSIAKSLVALHADGWVHKSFRSRSIVFFRDSGGDLQEDPFLVNFEFSRATESATKWTYDEDPELNLYRHPLRQRPPQKSFNQVHDLYALGVVLLEIGLWRTISSVKEQAQARVESEDRLDPDTLAECYVATAKRDLPHTMGNSYAEAVVKCLQGSFPVQCNDASFPLVVLDSVINSLDPKMLFKNGRNADRL